MEAETPGLFASKAAALSAEHSIVLGGLGESDRLSPQDGQGVRSQTLL